MTHFCGGYSVCTINQIKKKEKHKVKIPLVFDNLIVIYLLLNLFKHLFT